MDVFEIRKNQFRAREYIKELNNLELSKLLNKTMILKLEIKRELASRGYLINEL